MEFGTFRYSCKFPTCENKFFSPIIKDGYKNLSFFKFPISNPDLCQKWKSICNIGDNVKVNNFHICENHFLKEDFRGKGRSLLVLEAFPKDISKTSYPLNNEDDLFSANIHNDNDLQNCTDLLPFINTNSLNSLNSLTSPEHSLKELSKSDISINCSKFNFLSKDTQTEDLQEIEPLGKFKTKREQEMYRAHRNITSRLSKLKALLAKERNQNHTLKRLFDEGRFQFIEGNLNNVSKNFINSQLKNVGKSPTGKRWTDDDKIFALSIYKRSPRLYRYLICYFELPSPRTLKRVLSKLPFDPGFNDKILEHLKLEVSKMDDNDKYCSLLFDEMSLSAGLQYDPHRQIIIGYEDLGHLGRSIKPANHALAFMIRGIRKQWKQVIAYYFTSSTISAHSLKILIPYIITKLQDIGLKVISTVSDQGSTNRTALKNLSSENKTNSSPYTFRVNGEEICIIFDVPHLLKLTRNAIMRGTLEFEKGKRAKFAHIETAFILDKQERSFTQLPYLSNDDFNFHSDPFKKMKVKTAARQLSHRMAASIETFVSLGMMEAEAINTAEFAELIDQLFDLLNSNAQFPSKGKQYRCAFSADSPHLKFLSDLLPKLRSWKLFEPDTHDPKNFDKYKDVTSKQHFIWGWQITIRSILHLWNKLKGDLIFLPMRSFNQDPLENTFGLVRQHGITNTNPTCKQFTAALKTTVLNNLTVPITGGNCEADFCENLSNLSKLLNSSSSFSESNEECKDFEDEKDFQFDKVENRFGTAYTAGYLISKINVPTNCDSCSRILTTEVQNEHLFTQFREYDSTSRLKYADQNLIDITDQIYQITHSFLGNRGHEKQIEDKIKSVYKSTFENFILCKEHSQIYHNFINKCLRLSIFKYCKDQNKSITPAPKCGNQVQKVSRFKKQKIQNVNLTSTKSAVPITDKTPDCEMTQICDINPDFGQLPDYDAGSQSMNTKEISVSSLSPSSFFNLGTKLDVLQNKDLLDKDKKCSNTIFGNQIPEEMVEEEFSWVDYQPDLNPINEVIIDCDTDIFDEVPLE